MHKKPVRANAEINSTMRALITYTRQSFNSEFTERKLRWEWSNGKNTIAGKKTAKIILYYIETCKLQDFCAYDRY